MTFVALQERWDVIRKTIPQEDIDKCMLLLASFDEEQVRSTFDLLVSLDESALCCILHQVGGQLCIQPTVIAHHSLWEQCTLEEAMERESLWYALYRKGAFLHTEVRMYGDRIWNELSSEEQEKLDKDSLRSIEVLAGRFVMGNSTWSTAFDGEHPSHEVTLTKSMRVCAYACTQGLYESVMGRNPSYFVGARRPVEQVSWCDAVLFCNKLSEREGLEPCYQIPSGFVQACLTQSSDEDERLDTLSQHVVWNQEANGYRLLTEAEWEYCAKGGGNHRFSGSNHSQDVAWTDGITQPVGEKKANGFGLYDMSGNVFEWVWDCADYDKNWSLTGASLYSASPKVDPIVKASTHFRMQRGGYCQVRCGPYVSFREGYMASSRDNEVGFRFVRTIFSSSCD